MPKKQLTGKIVSLVSDKTVKVETKRQWQHPLYKKSVKKNKNYMADTNGQKFELGDEVMIQECRPVSKTKHFRVINKIKK